MTVQWGSYENSSSPFSAGMRVGIQVESQSAVVNGSTTFVLTVSFWTQNDGNYIDMQQLDLSTTKGVLSNSSIAYDNNNDHEVATKRGSNQTVTYTYGSSEYGTSPGTIALTVTASGVANGVTPTKTINVAIPARPWADPSATTSATASRTSDTQAAVSWTNHDATSAKYDKIKLYRKTGTGSYALIATLGVVTSHNDTGISANHKYLYRPNVLGKNGTEVTGDVTDTAVFTTPGAPSGLSAAKLGTGSIRVSWTNNVGYTEYQTDIYESQDGGAYAYVDSVAAGVTSWDHTSPSTSVTHRYKALTNKSGSSLFSAFSNESSLIQLLATANAPTGLSPSGVTQDGDDDIVFSWTHNPADGTPQSKYKIEYEVDGGSTVTVGPTSSATSSYTLTGGTIANGSTVTWRAYTAGENGTLSTASADASFDTAAKPTVTISAPTSSYDSSTLVVEWTYFQADDAAQAAWEASLFDDADTLLETISGTDETEGTFATTVADSTTYTVTVTVTSEDGLESDADSQEFTVTYLPPADVAVSAAYDADSGCMVLTVTGDDPVTDVTEAIDTVDIQRQIDGGDWVTIATGIELSGDPLTTTVLDTTPTINGTNTYRAVAFSALPSSVMSAEEEETTDEASWSFLSYGSGFGTILRCKATPQFDGAASRAKAVYQFAGRTRPVELAGDATRLAVSFAAQLRGTSSTVDEFEAAGKAAGVVCWREPGGRRIFASLGQVQTSRTTNLFSTVGFALTEVDYDEDAS